MHVFLLFAVTAFALAVTSSISVAQQPAATRHSNTDYVFDLVDAGDHFYVRTAGGLVQYDKATRKGTVFSNLTGLDDNLTWTMAVDDQQRLWLGTVGGLIRFDGEIREHYPIVLPDGRTPRFVRSIAFDGGNGFWVESYGDSATGRNTFTISHFDGSNWRHYDSSQGLTPGEYPSLLVIGPEEVWFAGTSDSLYGTNIGHIHQGKVTMYPLVPGMPGSVGYDYSLTCDSTGRIWVGARETSSTSLVFFEDDTWKPVEQSGFIAPGSITSLVTAPDGSVWIAGFDSVSRFFSNTWTTYRKPEFGGTPRSLTVGHHGTVWLATDSGASLFMNNAWRSYTIGQPLSSNNVTIVVPDSRGEILIGSELGVDRQAGDTWINYDVGNEPRRNVVDAVVDGSGVVWTISDVLDPFRGLSKWNGQTWEQISLKELGVFNDSIHCLARGVDGTMWFGASSGILHYDNTNWHVFTLDDSLRSLRQFLHIGSDSIGNIWSYCNSRVIAVDSQGQHTVNQVAELVKFDGSAWTTFQDNGSLIKLPKTSGGLEVDKKGTVWIYSLLYSDRQHGVTSFDGTRTELLTIPDASLNFAVAHTPRDMAIDHEDNLWFAIPSTLQQMRISLGQISTFTRDGWKHYTAREGFPGGDEHISPISLGFRPDHQLWIGTPYSGVVRMTNEQFEEFSVNDGLVSNNVFRIATGNNGSIWTLNDGIPYTIGMFSGLTELSNLPLSVKAYPSTTARFVASPNPGVEQTSLSLSFESGGILSVVLVDQLGRMVKPLFSGSYDAHTTLQIPVAREGLASGVYYVRAVLGSGESAIVKIALQ